MIRLPTKRKDTFNCTLHKRCLSNQMSYWPASMPWSRSDLNAATVAMSGMRATSSITERSKLRIRYCEDTLDYGRSKHRIKLRRFHFKDIRTEPTNVPRCLSKDDGRRVVAAVADARNARFHPHWTAGIDGGVIGVPASRWGSLNTLSNTYLEICKVLEREAN